MELINKIKELKKECSTLYWLAEKEYIELSKRRYKEIEEEQ